MASYTRLGSYLLSNDLATDPVGRIHRGLSLTGSAFDRHHLIRTFSDELVEAGFGGRIAEAQRVAGLLAGSRGFGANYHIEAGRTPNVVCDYIPGRSLAQVLKKTREEQIPLGVDHALSVVQGLAQSLMIMDGKDLHHGTLSTHSIWVSFEGATHLIDAPFGAVLQGLLPKAKGLEAALAPYRAPGSASALQQDLFALGSVLYEMLTLDKLPGREAIPAALAAASLKAAQEEGPIPAEIAALLSRLLIDPKPFATLGDFNKELERVLYDGDYSPTTFNMAFFMHTLFREESDQDTQAMKADQGADFTPFLPSDGGNRSVLVAADGTSRIKYLVWVGAVVVLLFGILAYNNHRNSKVNEDLQRQLASLQQEKAANDNKLQDITKQEEAQKILQEQLSKKATEAKTSEERAKAKKDLEEAKSRTEELTRQKDEALKEKQKIAEASQTIVAQNTPKPAPVAPAPPPPQPQPKPEPAPVTQVAQATIPTPAVAPPQDVVETSPSFSTRAPLSQPPRASAYKSFLPANLRDQDIKVTLKVFVDAQGHPVKVQIVNGINGPFGYNDAAQNSALASGYTPATRNGKPISAWLTVDYNFGKLK